MSHLDTEEKHSNSERNLAFQNLLKRVSNGDEDALSEFYDETNALVYGLSRKLLIEVEDAEEVSMEVYMQVWNKASDYDPEKSNPITWLLMITRARSIDKIRSGSTRNRLEESLGHDISDCGLDPEIEKYMEEKRQIIKNALSLLKDKQRKAIELVYIYGMSQSEIANEMNEPLGTVKSWVRLGIQKLKKELITLEGELT